MDEPLQLPEYAMSIMLGELEVILDGMGIAWRDVRCCGLQQAHGGAGCPHCPLRRDSENARQFNALPDSHDEWRRLNESEDGKPL